MVHEPSGRDGHGGGIHGYVAEKGFTVQRIYKNDGVRAIYPPARTTESGDVRTRAFSSLSMDCLRIETRAKRLLCTDAIYIFRVCAQCR